MRDLEREVDDVGADDGQLVARVDVHAHLAWVCPAAGRVVISDVTGCTSSTRSATPRSSSGWTLSVNSGTNIVGVSGSAASAAVRSYSAHLLRSSDR
jgi:hypothetical protein